MKLSRFNTIFRSAALFLCVVGILTLSTDKISAQATPEQTLTTFYKWYLHELNAERSPGPTSTKVSAVSSTRLRSWFRSKAGREWDADYFIDAQDLDKDWETNIAVDKAAIAGSRADVTVTLGPKNSEPNAIGPRVLRIKMLKETGGWKIDRVNGH